MVLIVTEKMFTEHTKDIMISKTRTKILEVKQEGSIFQMNFFVSLFFRFLVFLLRNHEEKKKKYIRGDDLKISLERKVMKFTSFM